MKIAISALALATALSLSGAAFAQVPSGGAGSDAKGNAPLKSGHTVNDGSARKGATSFTEGEARTHIVHAGYDSVTGLSKGKDGVWRGTAMKNGAQVNVGLDFKGNVSEGAMMASTTTSMAGAMTSAASSSTTATTTTAQTAEMAGGKPAMTHHRRHRKHRRHNHCANPTPNGAACSGVDRNQNGISDKEDRAIKAGAHP